VWCCGTWHHNVGFGRVVRCFVNAKSTKGDKRVSALEVVGTSKIFNQGTAKQVDALVDVNLTVSPGEFVSLIGP
ncbi:MAG: hypothetical protein ACKO93_04825, partial [Acidimicrobiaceae bacterium]